jgi:hypothetical protein
MVINLQNRLGDNLGAWIHIGADATIQQWIKVGVPMTFLVKPNKTFLANPFFSTIHRTFIEHEIKDMLSK